jgi:hypothetical protein
VLGKRVDAAQIPEVIAQMQDWIDPQLLVDETLKAAS